MIRAYGDKYLCHRCLIDGDNDPGFSKTQRCQQSRYTWDCSGSAASSYVFGFQILLILTVLIEQAQTRKQTDSTSSGGSGQNAHVEIGGNSWPTAAITHVTATLIVNF